MPITFTKNAQAVPAVTKLIDLGKGSAIDDIYVTKDEAAPMSSGIFTVEKADEPFVYTYKYHEHKIILEGELWLQDESGNVLKGTPGDVVYIEAGSTITFSSPTFGKAFYVGQRKLRDF